MSQLLWKDSRLLLCNSKKNLELDPRDSPRTETPKKGVLLQGEAPEQKSLLNFIRQDLIPCRLLAILDILGSPVGTLVLDRTDIKGSPVGTPAIDRIDTRGSPAGTPLDLDTIKGLPVGDSQHHASGLHLETEVDRGLTIDHSQNPLIDQNHLDTTLIRGKVGHPTGQTVQTGTVPCPPGTPTLS